MNEQHPRIAGKCIQHGDQWFAERKIYEDGTMTTEAMLTPDYTSAFEFMLTGAKDGDQKQTS
tara:strand:+ start:240 stop:425 length:186 start_codon:yes stop_codon:yes gene_type:complete